MMGEGLGSFFVGTLGLLVLFVISLVIAFSREIPGSTKDFKSMVLLTVGAHLLHFTEESAYGFYVLFPKLLGLAPWPLWLFLGFNFFWVTVWLIGIHLGHPNRFFIATFWFLGLASTVNAIAHPALSFLVAGYFPGLASSPLVGVLGLLLLRQLNQAGGSKPSKEIG